MVIIGINITMKIVITIVIIVTLAVVGDLSVDRAHGRASNGCGLCWDVASICK